MQISPMKDYINVDFTKKKLHQCYYVSFVRIPPLSQSEWKLKVPIKRHFKKAFTERLYNIS